MPVPMCLQVCQSLRFSFISSIISTIPFVRSALDVVAVLILYRAVPSEVICHFWLLVKATSSQKRGLTIIIVSKACIHSAG